MDAQFRTSVPHIFAAGDVIGYPSLAATSCANSVASGIDAVGAAPSSVIVFIPPNRDRLRRSEPSAVRMNNSMADCFA